MDPAVAKSFLRAAKAGDAATIASLLDADPGLLAALDADGSTALHCAAWKGHVEAVRLLITRGADVHAVNQNDHWGDTPLHAAAHGNQRAVAEALLDAGADPNRRSAFGRTPLEETEFHRASAVAKLLRARGAIG